MVARIALYRPERDSWKMPVDRNEQTLSWPLAVVGLWIALCMSALATDSMGGHLAPSVLRWRSDTRFNSRSRLRAH